MISDKFSQRQRMLQYDILRWRKEVANFTQKLRRAESPFLVTVPECCKTDLVGLSVCLSLIFGKLLLITYKGRGLHEANENFLFKLSFCKEQAAYPRISPN